MAFNVRLFGYSGIIQVGQSHAQQYSGDAVFLNEEPCLWSQLLVCDGATVATSARITTVPDGTQMVCVEVPDNHEIRYEVVQPGAAARAVSDNSRRGSGSFNLAWNPGYALSIMEVVAPAVPTTWNPADKNASIALSNGNLTANATGVGFYGAVRAVAGKSSGKYYYEGTYPSDFLGANQIVGIGSASASLANYLGNAQSGGLDGDGGISLNIGGGADGNPAIGDIVSFAVDVDNLKIWFRVNGGNWNGGALNDPAANIGGKSFSAVITPPIFPMWNGGFNQGIFTANFGATAFAYSVPSGFTSGWTA